MSTPAKSDKHSSYFQAIVFGGVNHKITISGTQARVQLTNGACSLISVFPTIDCWLKIGASNVTAAANDGTSMFLPGGIKDFIGVPESLIAAGAIYVSVIQDSAGGDLHINEAA